MHQLPLNYVGRMINQMWHGSIHFTSNSKKSWIGRTKKHFFKGYFYRWLLFMNCHLKEYQHPEKLQSFTKVRIESGNLVNTSASFLSEYKTDSEWLSFLHWLCYLPAAPFLILRSISGNAGKRKNPGGFFSLVSACVCGVFIVWIFWTWKSWQAFEKGWFLSHSTV